MKEIILQIPDKMTRSKRFIAEIQSHTAFKNAKTILSFSSMPDEVQLQDFNENIFGSKKLLLPRINGEHIEIVAYNGDWKREESYGILEPTGVVFKHLNAIDLILVPGLAFDKSMNRLGRGKAYYDRFLSNTQALKFGVCFAEQYIESLPAGDHDIRMDEVIVI